MKLHVTNTPHGLVPIDDESYDEKKKLKVGQDYEVEIKLARNLGFHKKYFSLINVAWALLPERVHVLWHSKDNFRKSMEITAGYSEIFFSPKLGDWVEGPRSIAFDKMDEAEFNDLYLKVRHVIDTIVSKYVSPETFERELLRF